MLGVGADFAGYQLEGVLGQGGMGTVYLARHPRLPRSVALKLLNQQVSTDPELTRRFELEADVAARLEHPGIVGVFDRGVEQGHLWIAMQYVRGTDASAWDGRAQPVTTTARLIGETAAALDYAHSRAVLHRDVKPANILFADAAAGRESHSVLTDFGIARLTDANTKLTATGTFTATIAYGSPEQLSGEVVDERSDQYSLACTLFAILAGHPPYAATNPGQVVMGHLSKPVPRLTATRPDLPPAADAVLARAMAKQRDERFGSCSEFTTAFRDALEGKHVALPVAPPSSNAHPVAPAADRRPEQWVDPAAWPPPGGPVPMAGPHPLVAGGGYPWPGGAVPYGPAPSKAAAVVAALLMTLFGLLSAALFVYGGIETIDMINTGAHYAADSFVALVVVGIVTALSGGSGLLLFMATRVGRVLTIVSSAIAVLLATFGIGATLVSKNADPLGPCVLGFLFFGTVLVCASVRSTGRWIAYRAALRSAGRRR
ncbi:serine/threonine-protein kinase [Nocardia amikacinitolerans]|uniref:serine/threonine-protein kinase n=1 Tax=Nocardia amikacinitolerans TaxID=756689 RepID=UPI0020A4A7EE|nr:serine/threonine-protein kinase [Nocardia amikacinitolerans]MCP2287452.1 serine/threonine protein kinase [Nocardia amikacinitolerans]